MTKLIPRCHDKKNPAVTSTGHLVPCCWCDNGRTEFYEDIKKFGLYDEELRLDNVSSVKDIVLSKQWVKFHYTLLTDPENSPLICKERCSENSKDSDDDE